MGNYGSLNKGPPTMLQSFPTTVKSVNLVSENSQLLNEITDSKKNSKEISKQTNFKTDSLNTDTISKYKATAYLQSKSTELDTDVRKTEISPLSNTKWIEKEMNTVSQGKEKTLLDISQSSRDSLEASKNGQNIKKTTSSFDVDNDIKELSKTTLVIHLSSDAKTQVENRNTESRKKSTDSQKTSKIDLNESQTIIKYDYSNLESSKDLEEENGRTKETSILLSTENVDIMADNNLKMTLNAVPEDTTSFKGTKRTITKQKEIYTLPPETIKSTKEDLNGQLEMSNHMKIGTKITTTLETLTLPEMSAMKNSIFHDSGTDSDGNIIPITQNSKLELSEAKTPISHEVDADEKATTTDSRTTTCVCPSTTTSITTTQITTGFVTVSGDCLCPIIPSDMLEEETATNMPDTQGKRRRRKEIDEMDLYVDNFDQKILKKMPFLKFY